MAFTFFRGSDSRMVYSMGLVVVVSSSTPGWDNVGDQKVKCEC